MEFDLEVLTTFVNEQIAFHSQLLNQAREAGDERKTTRHQTILNRYNQLLELVSAYSERSRKPSTPRLALTWEEVQDLPPELIKELSVSDGDKLEFDVVQILEDVGGVAALDRLLVHLFRRTGEIYQRTWLNNRLYRMVQKEMIYSVPGRKGVYSLEPLSKEEASELL